MAFAQDAGVAGRYIWRAGDTPPAVASALGVTPEALSEANPGLRFDRLLPGAAIALPETAPACARGALIRVADDDSVASLATSLNVTVASLMDANPYADPEALVEGQLLVAPAAEGYEAGRPRPTSAAAAVEAAPASRDRARRTAVVAAEGYETRSVRYGQSLADLLIENDISYQAFRLANPNLDPEALLPGQRYRLPPAAMRGACLGAGLTHVMAPGETSEDLANRFSLTMDALFRLNPNLAPSDFSAGRAVCVSSDSE